MSTTHVRIHHGTTILGAILFGVCLLVVVPASAALQSLQTGMEAPDFALEDLSGKTVAFPDIRGDKLTVLVFWSTWSSSSGKALGRMEILHQKYRDSGLSVVGINVENEQIPDEAVTAIRGMVGELGLSFPVLIDRGLTAFHDFGIIAVPTTVILDKDRVMRYDLPGYPLVGSEEMVDFVVATIEGKPVSTEATAKAGYRPEKKAVRFWNMGNKALKSRRMAATAEAWFKKAIEADPAFVLPYLSLGSFYLAGEEHAKAEEQFSLVLEKDPGNIKALCELGMLRARDVSRIDEAKKLFRQAIELSDSYGPCYSYMGFVTAESGDLAEADTWFDKARGVDPNDPTAFILRAQVHEKRGDTAEAAGNYRRAVELMLR